MTGDTTMSSNGGDSEVGRESGNVMIYDLCPKSVLGVIHWVGEHLVPRVLFVACVLFALYMNVYDVPVRDVRCLHQLVFTHRSFLFYLWHIRTPTGASTLILWSQTLQQTGKQKTKKLISCINRK